MSPEKTTLEVIAPSVEEAVQKGLDQLGVARNSVDVEILDQGSRGLFGIGSRQARIRLTLKSGESSFVPAESKEETEEEEQEQEVLFVEEEGQLDEMEFEGSISSSVEELEVARQTVQELLSRMHMKADVKASYRDSASGDEDDRVIAVDIEGNDLSILIGRRSETLNALQYIASLIVCKRLNSRVSVSIDVQGYRARRERQLRTLARRMAEQALHTGRRQVLEPMPASERRLIHLELRNNPDVSTESIGEEPNRKVTIFPKKGQS